jgi:hypothetical protein
VERRNMHDEIKNLKVLSISWDFLYFFSALTNHAGKILAAISPPASKYCTEWSVQKGGYRKESTEWRVQKGGYRKESTEWRVQKGGYRMECNSYTVELLSVT